MQAWEDFLREQETELGKETVEKWLRPLKIEKFDACNLYLKADDTFQCLWFEEHIRGRANRLVNGNNKKIKVHLSSSKNEEQKGKKNKGKGSKFQDQSAFKTEFKLQFDQLDPYSTFSNFLETESNKLVYQLFREISQNSNPAIQLGTFNPIFVYGPSGSGKSHLLIGLAHALTSNGYKVVYSRAETFTEQVVSSIRAGEMSQLRQIYRNVDVLIIDDLQVFSRKLATQEEFFHTFNTLHIEGKQIVLASNCYPQELQHIEPRLVSRFEWGIALPVKIVSQDNLKKILEIKAKALKFPLSNIVMEFLVETFTSNPKSLIRAFEALVLRIHLDPRYTLAQLTLPTTKSLLADLIEAELKKVITPSLIIQAVAEHYELRAEDILGKSQKRECVLSRQIAMHLCREKLKLPFMKIGEFFSRDHSTVMSSIKHIKKLMDDEHLETASALHAIKKKIQS